MLDSLSVNTDYLSAADSSFKASKSGLWITEGKCDQYRHTGEKPADKWWYFSRGR